MVNASQAEFSINIGLHVFILLTFLTIFFIVFVSRLTKKHVNDAIESFVKNNSDTVLSTIDEWDKKFSPTGKGNINWNKVDDMAKQIEDSSKGPSPEIDRHNKQVFQGSIIAVGVIFFTLVCVILYFKYYRKFSINMKGVLVENIIIFIFIGIIEFLFFYYISIKYIPVSPAFVGATVTNRVGQDLDNQIEHL